jgi:hypothetical protein
MLSAYINNHLDLILYSSKPTCWLVFPFYDVHVAFAIYTNVQRLLRCACYQPVEKGNFVGYRNIQLTLAITACLTPPTVRLQKIEIIVPRYLLCNFNEPIRHS